MYPTLQFLYSHHLVPAYISKDVRELVGAIPGQTADATCEQFLRAAGKLHAADEQELGAAPAAGGAASSSAAAAQLSIQLVHSHVRQNPQYTLAALSQGCYVIGMKDQFNPHDLPAHALAKHVQYVADEMGFVLCGGGGGGGTTSKSVDGLGPYSIEQAILMEVLSKNEVAQNVLEYYVHKKEVLQLGVNNYNEAQGKGYICWRFITEFRQPAPPTPR